MSDLTAVNVGMILLIASIVAMTTRRMHLPYSVGLVAAGILLTLLPVKIGFSLSPDLIFTTLLPPLIFEGALQIRWSPFRRELPVTLTLAFFGVILAAFVVAIGMHELIGWSWLAAAIFGFLIAATDPVSVISTFRETRVEPRLSLLVEAESLLNDGVAAVGFAVTVAIADGSSIVPVAISGLLLWKLLGGVIVGGGVAGSLLMLAGRTDDHLVEITLTTIAAYGAFLIGERFETSGVLAALTAGLVVANIGGRGYLSQVGRSHIMSFWEYAAFLANSVVFILIGLQEGSRARGLVSLAAGVAIVLVLLGRAVSVYALCALFHRRRLAVEQRYQHMLVWGGLRGALGLALALTVPDNVPERDAMIISAFAVVTFSIFVQGLTMAPLIRRLGVQAR
jgi:CPA1 family monovalent cation:H+ antiporter